MNPLFMTLSRFAISRMVKLCHEPIFPNSGVAVAIVVVDVALKPEILDPQGRAIVGALGRVGLSGVTDVRQGKQFVLSIEGDIDDLKLVQIHEIASTLLSNPVIEDFTVQVRP
jgi:phosphoribosylformylglycinamidine synthase PurS subunit